MRARRVGLAGPAGWARLCSLSPSVFRFPACDSVAKERPRTPHICSLKGEMAKRNPGLNPQRAKPLVSSGVTASGLRSALRGPRRSRILGAAVPLGGGTLFLQ